LKQKRAAIYTRVSTGEQNADLQTVELPEFCERRGWSLGADTTYSDEQRRNDRREGQTASAG
jgi:DNA invertase Pin-like site-specific DNA recombinase